LQDRAVSACLVVSLLAAILAEEVRRPCMLELVAVRVRVARGSESDKPSWVGTSPVFGLVCEPEVVHGKPHLDCLWH
jgi:hypothetical protein